MKNKSINNTFNYSIKNNSTLSFSNFSKRGDLLEDVSLVNDLKGKLLSTGYADKFGILIFENVPYDSYLIEIESSKMYSPEASLLLPYFVSAFSQRIRL